MEPQHIGMIVLAVIAAAAVVWLIGWLAWRRLRPARAELPELLEAGEGKTETMKVDMYRDAKYDPLGPQTARGGVIKVVDPESGEPSGATIDVRDHPKLTVLSADGDEIYFEHYKTAQGADYYGYVDDDGATTTKTGIVITRQSP